MPYKRFLTVLFCLIFIDASASFAQVEDDDVDNLVLKVVSPLVVRLSWTSSKPYPCAAALTYSVFQGTTEDFTPDESNQIASGVKTSYYLVHEKKGSLDDFYYHVRPFRLASACSQSSQGGKERVQLSEPPSGRLSALEKKVESLENTVNFYKILLDSKQTRTDTVQLDATSRNFERLDASNASFLVSVSDASTYLNGYRLKIAIGNPTAGRYPGSIIKIRWGRKYDWKSYDPVSYKTWSDSVKEKTVTLTSDLLPGSWNSVSLDLVPASADELSFLELSLSCPSVILTNK